MMNSPDIFTKRLGLKPYEYPELLEYVDAIRHSYWIHTEYNYTSDIHDFKTNISEAERTAIKRAMLAIAQIEVAVKSFWGNLHQKLPKPEVGSVGATFSENEVRHHDAYAHLLEILGLNDEFDRLYEYKPIMGRVQYLEDALKYMGASENHNFAKTLIFFSLLVENVSLFSQFFIIMSFNKHRNLFKGISNVIEASSKEESLHGQFGAKLVTIMQEEHPEWFDKEMQKSIHDMCVRAFEAECEIVDWIFEEGGVEFVPPVMVKEYIKHRINTSLADMNMPMLFDIDASLLAQTEWFDDEVLVTKHVDFFVKRSINYSKKTKSVTSDDLF